MRAPDRMREAVNVSGRPFWDDGIETMTPDARRRLEDERLGEQIAYDYATSPYYRSKLDEAGVRPGDVRGVDDLAAIPFMEKTEVAASQADGTLLGVNQCAPLDRIVRIQATGGTTGQPIRVGLTRRDTEDYGEMGARALWAMGCRPGEVVFECMPTISNDVAALRVDDDRCVFIIAWRAWDLEDAGSVGRPVPADIPVDVVRSDLVVFASGYVRDRDRSRARITSPVVRDPALDGDARPIGRPRHV